MNLLSVLDALRRSRPVFHSEADFQFALAWEIQRTYPAAEIRLEYPPPGEPRKHIDILVRNEGYAYPVELKYAMEKLYAVVRDEQFSLKEQGAQDIESYDLVKDLCRVESFASHLPGFGCGYVLWLTNDPVFWKAPNPRVGYADFSVHQGARKAGTMRWGEHVGLGTKQGRKKELLLRGEYAIDWREYSDLGIPNGRFRYALMRVE